jgi:hypothetical protein
VDADRQSGGGDRLHRGSDMILMAMHAAGRQQTQHMHRALGFFRRRDQGGERRQCRERAVGDGVVDPGQVLHDDAAGADIHVADFGVAHLARGQADRPAGGRQQGVWAFRGHPVEILRLRQRDGIVLSVQPVAPPVENAQHRRPRALLSGGVGHGHSGEVCCRK